MKNLFSLFTLAILLLLTSCGNDEVKSTRSFTSNMVNTVVSTGGAVQAFDGQYMFEIDNVKNTMDITAKGVKFSPNMPAITFVLKNVPFTLDNKGYNLNAQNIVPEVDGTAMAQYTITQLTGRMFPQTTVDQTTFADQVSLSYTLTSGTKINAATQSMSFLFNTTTTVNMGPTSYTNQTSLYTLNINASSSKASLIIVGAKFADKMPAMNMAFTDMTLTPTATGFKVEKASLVPNILGNDGSLTPFPSYTITNLVATVVNNKLTLTFTCTITATGSTVAGSFNVSASATLFPTSSVN